jgi:hypothetical protein
MSSSTLLADGQASFEAGVDSGRSPTISNPMQEPGLKPNQLSWAANATMRGGGVSCRTGWRKLTLLHPGATEPAFIGGVDIFQGASMYEPLSGFPYIVISLGGHYYRIRVDTDNTVEDISIPADFNPPTLPQAWFCQAEEFLVGQDGASVPLIWDGTALRRSVLANSEIPVGTAMDYHMGRLWVANGRTYVASDIVGGPTGTAPYALRDSVLRFTEAGFLAGGGAIIVPTQAGNITAIKHTANLDTALGEGQLFVFTRSTVYALNVPTTRADWYASTNPLQRVVQVRYGATSQASVAHVNGDLFYRAPDGIRSLMLAIRYFQQWGNVPISSNVSRVTDREDRGLGRYSSAIEFGNRIWNTCLPTVTPQGVVHNGALILDFDLISSLSERQPPAWEGMYQGVNILQLLEADYGGLQRAFSVARSDAGEIEIWEMTTSDRFEDIDGRIQWAIETPSYVWRNPFLCKELMGGTLYVDKEFGEVDYEVYYRPDQHPCWTFWHAWKGCAIKNACEDPNPASCYIMQTYREQYHAYSLPAPPIKSNEVVMSQMRRGYEFQMLIRVTGWARIRRMLWYAEPKTEPPYQWIVG